MRDKTNEQVGEVHHSAVTIAAQAFLCMQEQRVGREWLLKMKHAHERMGIMLERLEKGL